MGTLTVQLHPIGQATSSRDWVSERVSLADGLFARIDVRSNSHGDISMTSLYTERGTYAAPTALRRSHR